MIVPNIIDGVFTLDGILKGIISEYVDDSINLINARVYADERGFEIKEAIF